MGGSYQTTLHSTLPTLSAPAQSQLMEVAAGPGGGMLKDC